MASQPIVRVEHLSKVFHRDSAEVTALDDASLEIAAGSSWP
jgi:ABC-type oligopeptide transport system ATPase subunit